MISVSQKECYGRAGSIAPKCLFCQSGVNIGKRVHDFEDKDRRAPEDDMAGAFSQT
jgi:hypothetical protein